MSNDVKKRRAMRQKRIRQRRMLIALFCLIGIGIITLVIMCFTTFFPIKKYSVTGITLCTKDEIISASGLANGQRQLLTLSTDEIENNIYDNVAYVEAVTVKKVFPDAVKIEITEAEDTAYFISNENYYILSDGGKIIKSQPEQPEGLYEIVANGIEGELCDTVYYAKASDKDLVNEIISSLKDKKIKINKIDISNNIEITVNVENDIDVIFGTKENLDRKIAQLSTMLGELGGRTGSINLSAWTPQNAQGIFTEK